MSHSSFFWYDMVSKDSPATRAFMADLFGWTPFDDTMPDGTPYTSFSTSGNLVCGLMPLTAARNFEGDQAYWMSYLQVENLSYAQAHVERHGGTLIGDPQPVPDVGFYQVARDPSGALLSVIEAQQTVLGNNFSWHTVIWNELCVPGGGTGGGTIKAFYRSIAGWAHMATTSNGFDYGFFTRQGSNMAGFLELQHTASRDARPSWQVYFAVKNVDSITERVKKLGGYVVAKPFDLPGIGRIALIMDPGHCQFSLLQSYP